MTNEAPKTGETWVSDIGEEWYIIGPCLPDGWVAGQRAHGGGRVTRFDTQTLTGAGNHVVLTHKKPEPLELWAVVDEGDIAGIYNYLDDALDYRNTHAPAHRVVHLREVAS